MHKLAIITGGNAGLGFECAKRALSEGYRVCLVSRSLNRAEIARKELLRYMPTGEIILKELDLADLGAVNDFCLAFDSPWDLLINNAGAKIERPFKKTTQGHEWHIGVNHLAHFALTAGLMRLANEGATVTSVSSIVARRGALDFLTNQESETFNPSAAYANSKLMNLIFALELAERFRGTRFNSTAAHPGFARASAYGTRAVRVAEYLMAQPARIGAESIWKATTVENGTYLGPKFFELWGSPATASIPRAEPLDVEVFWKTSEALTGVSFPVGKI